MSEIFPNKNPILFGQAEDSIAIIDDEAVAGLTGSLIQAKNTDQGISGFPASSQGGALPVRQTTSGGIGNDLITFSNVLTPADSVLIIVVACATFSAAGAFSKDWLLKRDATTLDSFSLATGDTGSIDVNMRVFVDANPTAGTFDYTLTEDDATTFGAISVTLFFIKATDTHAGVIATPATAIKQINSPDSHTTRQTEVIP